MVMKKIIAFIICLALCVSGLAVGMMNQRANDAGILNAGASAAVGVNNVNIQLDDIAASGYDDSKVGASSLPAAASPNSDNGTLTGPDESGVYTLTGDVVIEDANDEVYKALVEIFEKYVDTDDDGTADAIVLGENSYTLNGDGHTITTAIPLFNVIGNCAIRNLVIDGDITTSETFKDAKGYYYASIIANVVCGEVYFEDVNVTASLTLDSGSANGGLSAFIGSTSNNVAAARVTVSNCAFSGTLSWHKSSLQEVKGAAVVANIRAESKDYAATVNVDKFSMDGAIDLNGHIAGIAGDVNSNATLVVTNTHVDMNTNLQHEFGLTGFCGGIIGNQSSSSSTSIINSRVSGIFAINLTGAVERIDAGGIIGRYSGGTTSLKDVVTTLHIEKNTDNPAFYGGVFGRLNASDCTLDGVSTTFGGKNAKISIIKTSTDSAKEADCSVGGVFGYMDGTKTYTLKNSNITTEIDCSATSPGNIGGVVGCIKSTGTLIIDSSIINTTISYSGGHAGGDIGVAGVVGDFSSAATVKINKTQMKSNISVTGKSSSSALGGVVGYGSAAATLKITESTLDGILTKAAGTSSTTGGVIGRITAVGMTLDIHGLEVKNTFHLNVKEHYAGGIIGYTNKTLNYIHIKDVAFNGTVTSTYGAGMGGLIGVSNGVTGTVEDSEYGIVFDNVTVNGNFNYPLNSGDIAYGTFIGLQNVAVTNGISLVNCVNNASMTVSVGESNNTVLAMGGFIGRTQAGGIKISFENCVNNGNLSYTSRSGWVEKARNNYVGGFVGFSVGADNFTFTDCVNNGNISATLESTEASTIQNLMSAGFIGNANDKTGVYNFNTCMNTGDITASANKRRTRAAGIINGYANQTLTDVVNLGNVSATNTANNDCRAAGITTNVEGTSSLTRCINAGDISNITNRTGQTAAGIATVLVTGNMDYCINLGEVINTSTYTAAIMAFGNRTDVNHITNCVNMGSVSSGNFVHVSAALDTITAKDFVNCYNLDKSVEHLLSSSDASIDDAEVTGVKTIYSAVPEYLKAANVKAAKVNNAKAYIALVLAAVSYDMNETNENYTEDLIADYIADLGVFTVDNKMTDDFICNTYVNEEFYDAIEAIAGDAKVDFDGIVVPVRVANAASAVTINGIEALMEENGIDTQLYFDADRNEQNIDKNVDVPASGKYTVKIVLRNGNNLEEGYTARAYIKIGGAYIYSTPNA